MDLQPDFLSDSNAVNNRIPDWSKEVCFNEQGKTCCAQFRNKCFAVARTDVEI